MDNLPPVEEGEPLEALGAVIRAAAWSRELTLAPGPKDSTSCLEEGPGDALVSGGAWAEEEAGPPVLELAPASELAAP